MASSIELYQRAYDLDYRQGDWQYAEDLYKEIIEQHPYSDEKDYAHVHLDRINKLKSNPHDQTLQPVHGNSNAGIAVVAFVFVLMLSVATGFLGYYMARQQRQLNANNIIIHGLTSEIHGNHNDALNNYKQAQRITPNNDLPFRLSAELYLKNDKFDLAEIEFKRWKLLSPFDQTKQNFHDRLQNKAGE